MSSTSAIKQMISEHSQELREVIGHVTEEAMYEYIYHHYHIGNISLADKLFNRVVKKRPMIQHLRRIWQADEILDFLEVVVE